MCRDEMLVITCPDTRCESCVHGTVSHRCELIVSGVSKSLKVLLIEPDRHLIHLTRQGIVSPTEPPWYGNSWETIYMDKLELLTVDHPDSIEVFVDERFSPTPAMDFHVYQVREKRIPVSAYDHNGTDILPLIKEKDDSYVSGFELVRDLLQDQRVLYFGAGRTSEEAARPCMIQKHGIRLK